jgi:hypothetical protein
MNVEGALAEIATIGIDAMQELISVDIIEQITDKLPVLMEQLLGDIKTLKNPYTTRKSASTAIS